MGHCLRKARVSLTASSYPSKPSLTLRAARSDLPSTLVSLGESSSATVTSYPAYSAKKVSFILDSTLGYS